MHIFLLYFFFWIFVVGLFFFSSLQGFSVEEPYKAGALDLSPLSAMHSWLMKFTLVDPRWALRNVQIATTGRAWPLPTGHMGQPHCSSYPKMEDSVHNNLPTPSAALERCFSQMVEAAAVVPTLDLQHPLPSAGHPKMLQCLPGCPLHALQYPPWGA